MGCRLRYGIMCNGGGRVILHRGCMCVCVNMGAASALELTLWRST